MSGLWQHLGVSLRLHFRNRMALLYGYVFPLIFLVAFWVLYRHEKIPLLRHMGELLTVTILGGACFGLPTTLVSERERGLWRRYRLTPVPTWSIVASTVMARYLILLSAGLLQLAVALAVGMTLPAHLFGLWIAFTSVAFAFIGLGLVIAAFADNVPAVQALGQCIFLPMLIIGGVAVSLASLPAWAQHVSAFFPGRYAVEALQGTVTGHGLIAVKFSLLALALTGLAGVATGAKLFRWDVQQSRLGTGSRLWTGPVLIAWLAVGLLAEARGRIAIGMDAKAPTALPPSSVASSWESITAHDVASLNFRVPSDGGVVAPFAAASDEPDPETDAQLDIVRRRLPTWPPGITGDDVTRVRRLLCVVAVPDVLQRPVERFLPALVLEHLAATYPKAKLIKILTWIAQHPEDGPVLDHISELGVEGFVGDPFQVRERVYLYSLKFILRLTGRAT